MWQKNTGRQEAVGEYSMSLALYRMYVQYLCSMTPSQNPSQMRLGIIIMMAWRNLLRDARLVMWIIEKCDAFFPTTWHSNLRRDTFRERNCLGASECNYWSFLCVRKFGGVCGSLRRPVMSRRIVGRVVPRCIQRFSVIAVVGEWSFTCSVNISLLKQLNQ